MFTGLTSQVSSWMGSAKGENEEKVPTPTEDTNAMSDLNKKDISPTKQTGSKLEVLTNVKSQIEGIGGWLGSSIPKFRKGEEVPAESAVDQVTEESVLTDSANKGIPKDDDENSRSWKLPSFFTPQAGETKIEQVEESSAVLGVSATGGADSGPASNADTPTEDKDSNIGNVQSKALAGAKSFGSFLYSAVNKAGKAVSEAGAKVKETVEKNSILGEFNKEQEQFLKNQNSTTATSLPPWAGCANEDALKEECLSLSTDKRNFVRSPPAGVDFQFDYEVSYPIAMAIMEQDPNLEMMRYELVPKVISEENFWRNYFYRVSLICQANELSFMSREGDKYATENSSDPNLDASKNSHEFVSDSLQTSSEILAEVKEGMKKLTLEAKEKEEDWVRELEAELQDYEVVNEENGGNAKNENWEKEMDDLLQEDLK